MDTKTELSAAEEPKKKSYHEPLLIRHEPLRNITGQIKDSVEKPAQNEKLREKNSGDEI